MDLCDFEASLVYTASPRTAKATERKEIHEILTSFSPVILNILSNISVKDNKYKTFEENVLATSSINVFRLDWENN